MASSKVISFEETPVSSIPSKAALVREAFRTHRAKPISYRLLQLRKLYWSLVDNTELILEACKKDLGKSEFESFLSDIDWAKNDAIFASKNLQKWAKDEPVTDLAFSNKILSPTIRKEPLGAVLVLGCWNYPINLSLCPLIGAIAAGCTAILKPSELAPACAMALKKVIEDSLDPEAYLVVNGGVEASTALLEHKWDKIFYTGNTQVGTIVAKKAAETLTPVTLELGGLNPAVVTRNADTRLAARRLLWSKASNAGQICLCPNYTLVHADILESLLAEFKIALKEFYPNGTKDSPDYGRIINERHFHRIKKMLDATNGKIVVGGNAVESEKFIEPTIVVVDSANDSLMKDEVFGPLITILPYTKLDEAIELINSVDSTPLALYPFGSKVETDRILDEVYSGGATVNDGLFHGGIHNLSFGGVGRSGQGAYRGKASFDTFTHLRTVVTTPNWAEALLGIRYPPYAGKIRKLQLGQNLTPDFDRQGQQIKGVKYWFSLLLSLGGSSFIGALMRWVGFAALTIATKKYLETRTDLTGYSK